MCRCLQQRGICSEKSCGRRDVPVRIAPPQPSDPPEATGGRESHEVADPGDGHFGEAQGLCLGLLAAGGLHHHLQKLVAQLLQGLLAIDQGGGVKVDVVKAAVGVKLVVRSKALQAVERVGRCDRLAVREGYGLYPTKSLSRLTLITLYGAKNPSSIPCFSEYV